MLRTVLLMLSCTLIINAAETLISIPFNDNLLTKNSSGELKTPSCQGIALVNDEKFGKVARFETASSLSTDTSFSTDEWEISFDFKPILRPLGNDEARRMNNILSITSSGTCLNLRLNEYRGQKKQLLSFVAFLSDGKPAICETSREFDSGKWYKVLIACRRGELVMSINEETVQIAKYEGTIKAGNMLTLGAIVGDEAGSMSMELANFQLKGTSPVRQHTLTYKQINSRDWHLENKGNGKLTLEDLADGTMKVSYNGGDGEAILYNKLQVYGEAGKNQIRATGLYRITDEEYGSVMRLSLNYGVESRIMSMSGDKPYPPGFQVKPVNDWGRFDFSVPADLGAPYQLRFTFRGNPMTVIIKNCSIYTAQIVDGGRPPESPEPRNYDHAKVMKSLSKMKAVEAKLQKQDNMVELILDDKVVFPAIYRRGPHYPFWSRYANFRDAGINLYTFFAFFGKASEYHKMNVGQLWLGKDRYDFSKVADELRAIHAINPNARVITALHVDPYFGWEKDYPEATFTNANGEHGYGLTTCKVLFYGKDKEPARLAHLNEEWFAPPSLYGEEFRTEAAKAVEAFCRFLNSDPAGKIVCGVHICGGADAQFFPFDRDVTSGEDHSLSAQRAWQKFLRNKYQNNPELLHKAWKNASATFEAPGIPTLTERGMDSSGIQPSERGRDYSLFISDALTEFRLAMFKAVKVGSDRRLLAGAYYPPGEGGNFHIDKMLASPDTDFLIDILRYSPAGSFLFHGKLHIAELDLRVDDVMIPILNYTYDRMHYESLTRQATAQSCQRLAGGYHLFDLGEAAYYNPKTAAFFGKVRSELADALDGTLSIRPNIGVFMDYRHLVGHQYRNESRLYDVVTQETCYALERSGVPFQIYQFGDIFHESFIFPKIIVFPLMPDLTVEQLATLRRKAAAAGSSIIWGFYRSSQKIDATTIYGYRLTYPVAMAYRQLRAIQSPLSNGMENLIIGRSYSAYDANGFYQWFGIPAVIQPEPGDKILAVYQPEQLPGMIMRQVGGVTEIINGAPGAFSPQFFRNIAAANNIEILSTNDNMVVMAENGILSILCERGGSNLQVMVPSGLKIVSSPTGHHYHFAAPKLTFDAPNDGEMVYFKMAKDIQ